DPIRRLAGAAGDPGPGGTAAAPRRPPPPRRPLRVGDVAGGDVLVYTGRSRRRAWWAPASANSSPRGPAPTAASVPRRVVATATTSPAASTEHGHAHARTLVFPDRRVGPRATVTIEMAARFSARPPGDGRRMTDRMADPWGSRTPYGPHDVVWPARVDTFLAPGVTEADVARWVPSASVLHSNGDAMDIAVAGGRIVGVRGRAADRVN